VPLVFAPGEAFQFDWSDDCMDNGMDPLHFLTGLVMGQNGVS